jgi:hypothetical protein
MMTDILTMQRAGKRPAFNWALVTAAAILVLLVASLFDTVSVRQVPPSRNLPAAWHGTFPGSYRGYRVEPLGAGLAVPELELAAASPQSLYRQVNTLLYRASSGRVDTAAEECYSAADRNGDGLLSKNEIDRFVRTVSADKGRFGISGLLSYWGVESLAEDEKQGEPGG